MVEQDGIKKQELWSQTNLDLRTHRPLNYYQCDPGYLRACFITYKMGLLSPN